MRILFLIGLYYCIFSLYTFAVAPIVDTNYQEIRRTTLIWNLGNQLTDPIDTIRSTVHETNNLIGENLRNTVAIKNDHLETDKHKDQLAALANVYIETAGPTTIELNETNQYQLIYGNNGMENAGGVVVSDTLPNEFRPLSTNNANCSINFQTITCTVGDLAVGAEDTILIDFMVAGMPFMIGTTVTNKANIRTDSSETDLADNEAEHETYITLLNLASISGTVWHDNDRNGRIEGTEQGIEMVIIHLSGTDIFGNPVNVTTTTNEDGLYAFLDLYPGTYAVEEEQPIGWLSSPYAKIGLVVRTINTPQDSLISHGSIGNKNGNETFQAIVLESGYQGIDYNFGEDLGSIGDTVWMDNNINGIHEIGEVGIEGITVRLYQSSNDSLIDTETTNAFGAYFFEDLLANDYYAVFDLGTLPDSINQVTVQNAANATIFTDSDADPTTGTTMVINLGAGVDDLSWSMGIYGAILIGNYIWIDRNKDSTQDETDVPLAGIHVTLFNNWGDSITTVQTNTDGYYYFHSDTLALANNGNDSLLHATTPYYLALGLGNQFNIDTELLFDSLQLIVDSIGSDLTDSNGELAVNIAPDFDGFPFLRINTPAFGGVDTTFDFGFQSVEFDWGDLPDTSVTTNSSDYQTLSANDGPRHIIIAGLNLGTTIDAEREGQPDDNALGDGNDEDGLTIFASTNVSPGGTIRLPFSYINTTDSTAYLKIWIDWNGDGKFNSTDEMVLVDNDEITPFANILTLTIPTDVQIGNLLGMRVRLSLSEITSPYGHLPNGEVEDYLIGVDCENRCLPIENTIIKK